LSGAKLALAARTIGHDAEAAAYTTAVLKSPFVHRLTTGTLPLEWCTVEMVSDDPAKVPGRAPRERFLWERLKT
jgi:cardiolipin synthase C